METLIKLKKAFTLAEMIIVIGVIGVVAAIGISTLVQNIQDAELKTAWKKEYASLNQIVQQIYTEESSTTSNMVSGWQYMPRCFCKMQKSDFQVKV